MSTATKLISDRQQEQASMSSSVIVPEASKEREEKNGKNILGSQKDTHRVKAFTLHAAYPGSIPTYGPLNTAE